MIDIKISKVIIYLIFFLFFCTILLSLSGYYQTHPYQGGGVSGK